MIFLVKIQPVGQSFGFYFMSYVSPSLLHQQTRDAGVFWQLTQNAADCLALECCRLICRLLLSCGSNSNACLGFPRVLAPYRWGGSVFGLTGKFASGIPHYVVSSSLEKSRRGRNVRRLRSLELNIVGNGSISWEFMTAVPAKHSLLLC